VNRARAAAAQIQVNQRLVRERDRQRSRELWRFLLTAAVLAVPVLGYVWQRVDFLRVSYHYERLQKERQTLLEQSEQLKVERATLMDHDRIERLARQRLGLVDPEPDDVRNVRLFDGRVGAVERTIEAGAIAAPIPVISKRPATAPPAGRNASGSAAGTRAKGRP